MSNDKDPYLEKLLRIQEEVNGIDLRLNALEEGYALDADEVDEFVKNRIASASVNFEYFLSSENIERIAKEYEDALKRGVECDALDYAMASLVGLFAGIIDAIFCSTPGEGIVAKSVDGLFDESVKKFAKLLNWKPKEAQKDNVKSAIGHLEKIAKVGYDQTTTQSVGGAVKHLSMKNHHAKSAGHYLDVFGLLFSICDQFNGTSTFYDNSKGKITVVDATNYSSEWAKEFFDRFRKETGINIKLQGNSFISKVIAGTMNWFIHCMSDIAGSSGSDGRGQGLPIPLTEFFQFCTPKIFRNEKEDLQSLATVMTEVYEEGYDMRHAATMSIPVIICDISIKMIRTLRGHFQYEKDWKDCIPSKSNPELQRMSTVGIGTLCCVDLTHAGVTSVEWIAFFSKLNLVAWSRFALQAEKELELYLNKEMRNIERVQEDIDKEWERLLERSRGLL